MPYLVKKSFGKWCVAKSDSGLVIKGGCHLNKEDADKHLKALYASEHKMAVEQKEIEAMLLELQTRLGEYSATNDEEIQTMQTLTASATTLPWSGEIAFEGVPTGDNRVFASGSITWEDPPLPLLWQKMSAEGHKSSVVIGRVDSITRDGASIKAAGVIFSGENAPEEATQYQYLLENGAAGGVSVDGDSAQFDLLKDEETGKEQVSFNQIRIRALTAVAIPAFSDASIELDTDDTEELAMKKRKKKKSIGNRAYSWGAEGDALVASAIKVKPPTNWFENPQLSEPTPLTVTKDGWVFGHIALFNTCHIGLPGCTKPPKNGTYQYFHTGELETEEGDLVEVGHLTFRTGHASHQINAFEAASHYDHTGTVGADVRAGEDQFGIWVAGSLRPHLTDIDIREFRAAPISGDWRRIGGRMEMVGALSVNVPGFPVPRARVLTAAGEPQTLIYSEDFGEIFEPDNAEQFSRIEIEARKALRAELSQKVLSLSAGIVTVQDGTIELTVGNGIETFNLDNLNTALDHVEDAIDYLEEDDDITNALAEARAAKNVLENAVKSKSKSKSKSDTNVDVVVDTDIDVYTAETIEFNLEHTSAAIGNLTDAISALENENIEGALSNLRSAADDLDSSIDSYDNGDDIETYKSNIVEFAGLFIDTDTEEFASCSGARRRVRAARRSLRKALRALRKCGGVQVVYVTPPPPPPPPPAPAPGMSSDSVEFADGTEHEFAMKGCKKCHKCKARANYSYAINSVTACGDEYTKDEHWYGPISEADHEFLMSTKAAHEAAVETLSNANGLSPVIQLFNLGMQKEIIKANLQISKWLEQSEAHQAMMEIQPQTETETYQSEVVSLDPKV